MKMNFKIIKLIYKKYLMGNMYKRDKQSLCGINIVILLTKAVYKNIKKKKTLEHFDLWQN